MDRARLVPLQDFVCGAPVDVRPVCTDRAGAVIDITEEVGL